MHRRSIAYRIKPVACVGVLATFLILPHLIRAESCSTTVCKPGYTKVGDSVTKCSLNDVVHEGPGCQECCAKGKGEAVADVCSINNESMNDAHQTTPRKAPFPQPQQPPTNAPARRALLV